MSAETWWIVGCVVVGAVGLWLVLRGRRAEVVGEPPKVMYSVKAPAPPPMPAGRMTTELAPLDHYVRKLAADGNKIEAIKAVREHTGLGLKEAKDYVEAIPNVPPLSSFSAGAPRDERPMDDSGVRRAAWDLITNDKKIEAIKLIREHFGWDLKRAKDYADAMQRTPAAGAAHALFVDANVSEILADSPMLRRAIERAYEKGMSEADITAMFVKLTGKDPAEVGPLVANMKPSQKPIE